MNMQPIVDDPELWEEFVKAYHIAGQYRPRVQFRKDLLCSPGTYIGNVLIFNGPDILINAFSGNIHPDLKG